MKNAIITVIVGLTIFALTSCAPVKFYSTQGLTENTGLKYYTVKPYLLVEKDLVNSIVVKATIIYLPDIANPHFIVVTGGIGSKKVDLKLKDGTIDTFSLTSDTKIPEMLEALAKLVPSGINALAELKSPSSVPKVGVASTTTELYEIFMGTEGTTVKKIEFK